MRFPVDDVQQDSGIIWLASRLLMLASIGEIRAEYWKMGVVPRGKLPFFTSLVHVAIDEFIRSLLEAVKFQDAEIKKIDRITGISKT